MRHTLLLIAPIVFLLASACAPAPAPAAGAGLPPEQITLTGTDDAVRTAQAIRSILLGSATVAAAVGADQWDRQRVLDLVK